MKFTTKIYRGLKKIIRLLPFKKELFSVVKIFVVPSKRIRRELKFNGSFKVKNKNSSFKFMNYDYEKYSLENDIFWYGLKGWEPISIKLWIELCNNSNIIFDVGANTGIYSIVAASLRPTSKIFSFEPVERIYEKFQSNILINNFLNIQAEKFALSDKNGVSILYDFLGDIPLNATLNNKWHSESDARVEKKIKTKRLDDFIDENQIKNIDLMKIDVELHEPEVLKGMGKYLEKFKPTMLIEIFNQDMWNQIQEIVGNINYLVFYIDEEKGVQKINSFNNFEGYNFLFCTKEIASKLFLPT